MKKTLMLLAATLALFLVVATGFAQSKTTLSVGIPGDAKSLDPHQATDTMSFTISMQINEPLVTMDGKTKKLVPILAERWEVVNPETYKFFLKKGVKFHNGDELTADDVVFSLRRAATESVHAKSWGKYIDPEGFKVIDKYTVIVKTKGPVGGFLQSMKHPYANIFSKKAVQAAGAEYFRNPVGTGPYMFKKWTKGESIELAAFEDYHGKKPAFKTLTFFVLPDDSSRVIALETKKVDMIYAVPTSDYDRLNASSKVNVVMGQGLRLLFLGMNTQKKPLSDPRVRLAIQYAINKEAYNQVVYQGQATVPEGPLVTASEFSAPNAKPYPFDQAKAKALLAQAGYPNGLTLSLWTGNFQDRVNGATVIQSMLDQVGIKVNIQVFESASFNTKMSGTDQDLFISQWGMQTNRDAGNYWTSLFHSSSIGTNNWALLKDSVVDTELDTVARIVDDKERTAHLQKVWDRLMELNPIVPLSIPYELYGAQNNLVGVENLADGQINSLLNLSKK
ncbi:ABC transporter substrate-binding protein [bacterium]|nr:ABC transporter substrate-binding protein [bacterium]